MWLLPAQAMAEGTLWFLYDEQNAHHRDYVERSTAQLRKELPALKLRRSGRAEAFDASEARSGDGSPVLLLSIGIKAARVAARTGLPTINTLITRRGFEALRAELPSPSTAVYLEQPILRHLQLVKSALPSRDKLSVLLGAESEPLAEELLRHAQRLGVQLQLIVVAEEGGIDKLFGRELLAEDTLLLLPDPEVVNRRTVKPLVLGSYHQGVPLVGYSKALVKAGALMAVHSSLAVLEGEALRMVKHYFQHASLPPPSYAAGFEVSANYQLARALNIPLPSEAELKQRLRGLSP